VAEAAVPAAAPVALERAEVMTPPAEAPAPAAVAPAASAAHAQCLADFGQLNWKAASESCALAYEQAPDATMALKVAHAQFARDNVGRAGAWASKALELGGTDADAFVLIGHAERQAGHLKSAIGAYRRYLQASPQGWHARDVRSAVRTLKAKLTETAEAAAAAPVASELPSP
jgi:tetratricopeptide (TPR) repeat protein